MKVLTLLYALDCPIEYMMRAYLRRYALNNGRRR
jgi:hypothetical protein